MNPARQYLTHNIGLLSAQRHSALMPLARAVGELGPSRERLLRREAPVSKPWLHKYMPLKLFRATDTKATKCRHHTYPGQYGACSTCMTVPPSPIMSPLKRKSNSHLWSQWMRSSDQSSNTCLLEGRSYITVGNACGILPTDVLEADNMDQLHVIMKDVFHANYHHTFDKKPARILDVGTGSGIWIKEMANEFPESEVVGCDILDLTGDEPMPANCRWYEGNVIQGLPFEDNSFDFVHQRHLGLNIPTKHWKKVLRELYRVCSPGGTINLVEMSFDWTPKSPAMQLLLELFENAAKPAGVNLDDVHQLESPLNDVGFVDVRMDRTPLGVGAWYGPNGRRLHEAVRRLINSSLPMLMRHNRIRRHELEQVINEALAEMDRHSGSITMVICRARKPL
jgi:SAM-dependent methyltransferase